MIWVGKKGGDFIKMCNIDYQDFVLNNKDMYGNSVDWNAKAEEDGFKGFVKVGMEFEL